MTRTSAYPYDARTSAYPYDAHRPPTRMTRARPPTRMTRARPPTRMTRARPPTRMTRILFVKQTMLQCNWLFGPKLGDHCLGDYPVIRHSQPRLNYYHRLHFLHNYYTITLCTSIVRKSYESVSEYCNTSLYAQSWKYRDRRKPEVGTMPYSYRMTSWVLYSAQYNTKHCTPQAFEASRIIKMCLVFFI